MARAILLMMKDTPVMRINFDEAIFDVLNEQLLPYVIKGKLRSFDDYDGATKYGKAMIARVAIDNSNAIQKWITQRVLPISRDNAKKIYQLFMFEQTQDDQNKMHIALICRAVSLQDNYWIKVEGDVTSWSDVNLRTNSLSEIVAQVSLHGTSLTLQGKVRTPELTGQGAYAKAWRREDSGLWLYKAGSKDSTESQIEVEVSKILDKCNVRHLNYEKRYDSDVMVCACPCMTTENISMLSAGDFLVYCNVNGLDYEEEYKKIDADMWYKMHIVDYLIANRDRHGLNHGFFINSDTNEIISAHPLYDHNNAFDPAYMRDPDANYQVFAKETSLRKAAQNAIRKVDFHFTAPIERKDFLSQAHYDCFMSRAKELGIQTVINDKLVWCRNNAPAALKILSDDELLAMMEDAYNRYISSK